jgi:hypothetical protein
MPLKIFRRAPRPGPLVRNRGFLRSPVMARLDELFADPEKNAVIYERCLGESPEHLDAGFVLALFEEFSPDRESFVGLPASEVVGHVFGHILGPDSWWGARGARWGGTRLFAAAFLDAMRRAQEHGNCPITTFHSQATSDGDLQLNVLDARSTIVLVVSTPPVPGLNEAAVVVPIVGKEPNPDYKTGIPINPIDDNMPEVSNFTHETMGLR